MEDVTGAPDQELTLGRNQARHYFKYDKPDDLIQLEQIAMYLSQGLKYTHIAEMMGQDRTTVARKAQDPRTRQILEGLIAQERMRLQSLFGNAVDAIAGGLASPDSKVALKAAQMVLEESRSAGTNSPESVFAEILQQGGTVEVSKTVARVHYEKPIDGDVEVLDAN